MKALKALTYAALLLINLHGEHVHLHETHHGGRRRHHTNVTGRE